MTPNRTPRAAQRASSRSNHEDEGGAGRDLGRHAGGAVAQPRRHDQPAAAADAHPLDAPFETRDRAFVAQREGEEFVPLPGGVEFLAGLVDDADVLDPTSSPRLATAPSPFSRSTTTSFFGGAPFGAVTSGFVLFDRRGPSSGGEACADVSPPESVWVVDAPDPADSFLPVAEDCFFPAVPCFPAAEDCFFPVGLLLPGRRRLLLPGRFPGAGRFGRPIAGAAAATGDRKQRAQRREAEESLHTTGDSTTSRTSRLSAGSPVRPIEALTYAYL